MLRRNRTVAVACAACIGLAPVAAYALTSDRDEPITIEADRVDIDEKTGLSTYTGNVRLAQGSTRIAAETITVLRQGKRLDMVTALGAPARYAQRPDNATEDVEAQASRIEFAAPEGVLVLSGEAELHQGGSRFNGSRIEYDTQRDLVRAAGSNDGAGGRIRVIIQPELLPGRGKKSGG